MVTPVSLRRLTKESIGRKEPPSVSEILELGEKYIPVFLDMAARRGQYWEYVFTARGDGEPQDSLLQGFVSWLERQGFTTSIQESEQDGIKYRSLVAHWA